MKRIFSILAALTLALGMLSSCGDYDYEEPAFYDDTIEWTISALGGQFPVQYKYVWYETKNITRKFDFVYRLIIDGVATEALEPDDVHSEYDPAEDARIYTFYVTIPANKTGHLRPILIEASTHIDMVDEVEDYWTEWFPVISTVQLY